jgi:thioredoxin reductase (NADPH)
VYLARQAAAVRLLIRQGELGRDMSRYLVDQIEQHPGIAVRTHTEVRELIGENGQLESLSVADRRSGHLHRVDVTRLFVFIGTQPRTAWLRGWLALDDDGYVQTPADRSTLETSRPGVLVAGDVRRGSIKRVTAAVGDGAIAIRLVHEYLARNGRTAGQ